MDIRIFIKWAAIDPGYEPPALSKSGDICEALRSLEFDIDSLIIERDQGVPACTEALLVNTALFRKPIAALPRDKPFALR
jgi:hypothetical protein